MLLGRARLAIRKSSGNRDFLQFVNCLVLIYGQGGSLPPNSLSGKQHFTPGLSPNREVLANTCQNTCREDRITCQKEIIYMKGQNSTDLLATLAIAPSASAFALNFRLKRDDDRRNLATSHTIVSVTSWPCRRSPKRP